jgi:ribosomal protein S18 acetylase RimI-like enzyme
LNEDDRAWMTPLLEEQWGSVTQVNRGRAYRADELPGFTAIQNGKPVGLITYQINGEQCEITSLNSLVEGVGIGTGLINGVKDVATNAGCNRLWLITTNDNTPALRFYQKRGFVLVAVYQNALEESRKLKPEIPLTGIDGIPLRDEIELEMPL